MIGRELKIIGFVGMPGSGKSVASDVARSMGLNVVVMGDVIRKEAARLGLEPSDKNLGMIGSMLREKEGADAIARRTLEIALAGTGKEKEKEKDSLVVVDGIRSAEEVEFFRRSSGEFHLIEIRADPRSRLDWISNRGRPDDLYDRRPDALKGRESREVGWGMKRAFDEADIRIENDGGLCEFKRSVKDLIEKLSGPASSD